MSNSFKGALPKDKNNARSPAVNLSRRASLDDSRTAPGTADISDEGRSSTSSMLGDETSTMRRDVDEVRTAMFTDDVSSGYELAPKPKMPCIPMFTENTSIRTVRSLLLYVTRSNMSKF